MLPFRLLVIFGLLLSGRVALAQQGAVRGEEPQKVEDVYLPQGADGVTVETWVDSLMVPWSLAFLPSGDALIAQRPGTILRVPQGTSEPHLYADVEEVATGIDAGLMGMAIHPNFGQEPYVYVMHTYRENGQLYNRVIRLEHREKRGAFDRVIFDKIRASRVHIGGRIDFGPDGMLYVGTGDLAEPPIAQDLKSLGGKILRLTPEGGVPEDNPFPRSPVYSYGHRVVQGLAWDPQTGAMFNSEHGPSGFKQEGRLKHRVVGLLCVGARQVRL